MALPPGSAGRVLVLVLVLVLGATQPGRATPVSEDLDYGGVPLWINRLLGEPSVLSLRGRGMDSAWYRANNPQACPLPCDCPIHWPSAVYCDHRALERTPASLPARTQYLFLQGNNISSLPSAALTNTSGLRWLILDHNRLKTAGVDRTALQNLTKLQYLFANHNRLTAVPTGLPAGLWQLRLAHNRISSIAPGTFQKLQNLTLLLLQGNRLTTVAPDHFTGLLHLNLLDLSSNQFSSVPRHLPRSVQQLYLSANPLAGLAEDSLAGLPRLRFLHLSGCGLRSPALHRRALNVTSLVELDLSHNLLSRTPTVPVTLQYLYLQANRISQFNVTSFCREVGPLSYSRMKILRLDGNKLASHQLPQDWVHCLRVLHHIYI